MDAGGGFVEFQYERHDERRSWNTSFISDSTVIYCIEGGSRYEERKRPSEGRLTD
jgi:hypothetical protein